jgi:hypothetical protein
VYKYAPDHKFFRSEKDFAKDLSIVLISKLSFRSKVGFIDSLLWGGRNASGSTVVAMAQRGPISITPKKGVRAFVMTIPFPEVY